MDVMVSLECRFVGTPDGRVWTQTQFPYAFWTRYLRVYDHVHVLARVEPVLSVPDDWTPSDGEGVSFVRVPYYVGPRQYVARYGCIHSAIRAATDLAIEKGHAVIMRVGSTIAAHISPALRQAGYPYAVEVVADPYDVFAPGSVKHPLRAFFRWYDPRRLRAECAGACAAAYVTEHALQARYPPAPDAFSTHYSSVDLPDGALVAEPRPIEAFPANGERPARLVFVGNLAQLYKAPDVLVEAVGVCAQQGLDVEMTMVGDGQYRPELERQAASLGLNGHVRFVGQVPAGEPVRAYLDRADVFCLPSHQEGLPRAMIEAMARGLPCIGSTVGGFPELLSEDEMVPPGDAVALAFRIRQMVSDPARMARLSAHNLDKAREYTNSVLDGRRVAFYRYLMNRTREWHKGRAARF